MSKRVSETSAAKVLRAYVIHNRTFWLDEQGGFHVVDHDHRVGSYSYPSSDFADRAKKNADKTALEVVTQALTYRGSDYRGLYAEAYHRERSESLALTSLGYTVTQVL